MATDEQQRQDIELTLTRSSAHGFAFAIGRSWVVSDVIEQGPAKGKLQTNDRVIQVNGQLVRHRREPMALQSIKDTADRLHLVVQRRTSPKRAEKHILPKPNPEQSFGLILACGYSAEDSPSITNLHPGDDPQSTVDFHSGKRLVSMFISDSSSIGIRLAGGNKYGLFIGEIQPDSVAFHAGLFVADKILTVNNLDFTDLTREEAVLYLLTLKACQLTMIVSNLPHDYEQLVGDIGGDSFYIRTHFASRTPRDLSIELNEIFHVVDTLANDRVGYWKAIKEEKQLGLIPNQSRAEQISHIAPRLDQLIKLEEKRKRHFPRRSSSTVKIDCWKPMIDSKFRAYERVRLKSVTIVRPVVFLGPLADIARDRLIEAYPDQFELPDLHLQSSSVTIIKLPSIKHVIDKNRHCLLDITPSAIEQLNYAECYPLVIFFRPVDRRQIKQIRTAYGQVSSRRLWSICRCLEENYSYLFTSTVPLDLSIEALKSHIDLQQDQPIWMSAERSNEKDFFASDEYFIWTTLDEQTKIPFQKPPVDVKQTIGQARGWIDGHGGKLVCPSTGVSLNIPAGALLNGLQREIYFEVRQTLSNDPQVICGPPGLRLLKSAELVLPRNGKESITILVDQLGEIISDRRRCPSRSRDRRIE